MLSLYPKEKTIKKNSTFRFITTWFFDNPPHCNTAMIDYSKFWAEPSAFHGKIIPVAYSYRYVDINNYNVVIVKQINVVSARP
jgi:hypothetical protein